MKILLMMLIPWMVMADTIYWQWDAADTAGQEWAHEIFPSTSFVTENGRNAMKVVFHPDSTEIDLGVGTSWLNLGPFVGANKTIYYRTVMKAPLGMRHNTKTGRMLFQGGGKVFTWYSTELGMYAHETSDENIFVPLYFEAGGPYLHFNLDSMMLLGGWHEIIVAFRCQTHIDSSNAGFKMWVDGSLVDSTTRRYRVVSTSADVYATWSGIFVNMYMVSTVDRYDYYMDDYTTSDYLVSDFGGSSLKNIGNMGTIDTVPIISGRNISWPLQSTYSGNAVFQRIVDGSVVWTSSILANGGRDTAECSNCPTGVHSFRIVSRP